MTKLIIAGKEVHLSADFTIDYYVYNPFFDRKGEFTYDIDINLKDADNAKLYAHLNRWNSNSKPKNRSAELWVDENCIVRGTEVVLSTDGDKVKIQIVAGNSELNYLVVSSDLTIRDLDLGLCDMSVEAALDSLWHSGADRDVVFPPIARVQRQFAVGWFVNEDIAAGMFYNNLLRPGHNEGSNTPRNDYNLSFASRNNLRPQPYLAAIVERVVRALGYNVSYNYLRHEHVFSKVYIVNAVQTANYNEMVPNWKVNDFIDEVEKWCNVVFLVDNANKSCRIISASDFYSSAGEVNIGKDNIRDSFERKYEEEVSANISYRNISYEMPNSAWHKYANLGQAKMSQFWRTEDTSITARNSLENKIIVYHRDLDVEVVGRYWENKATSGSDLVYWMPVNFLKEVITDESEERMTFRIVPAEVFGLSLYGRYWKGEGEGNVSVPCVREIPYATTQGNSDKEDGYATTSLIEGDETKKNVNSSNLMPVACYNGLQPVAVQADWIISQNPGLVNLKWPTSTVTNVTSALTATDGTIVQIIWNDNNDLRLTSLRDRIYNRNSSVDTTVVNKVCFYSNKVYDTKQFFVVANRRMYCRCLHYTIDAIGFKEEVEGEFFAM